MHQKELKTKMKKRYTLWTKICIKLFLEVVFYCLDLLLVSRKSFTTNRLFLISLYGQDSQPRATNNCQYPYY